MNKNDEEELFRKMNAEFPDAVERNPAEESSSNTLLDAKELGPKELEHAIGTLRDMVKLGEVRVEFLEERYLEIYLTIKDLSEKKVRKAVELSFVWL